MQLQSWATDEDFNEGVVSSNFLKAYRTVKEREKERRKIGQPILQILEQVGRPLQIGGTNGNQ